MLVAVAAMAFVGCEQDIEVNATTEKTAVRVIAGLDETRSGFGDKINGAYDQVWNGGEVLSYHHYNYNGYFTDNSNVTLPEGESKKAEFDIQLTGVGNAIYPNGVIRIASPASSATAVQGGFTIKVPTEQTPLANSVDPAAHILTSVVEYYDGVPSTIEAQFEHAVAYGKMTLNNLPEGNYDYVTISLDNRTYKLYTTNVQNNVFWFGCEAVKPAEVKVSVVNETENVAYTKTLDLTKATNFEFVTGRLGSFSVEMEGVKPTTPEDDSLNIDIDKLYDTVVWDSSNNRFKFTGASVNEWRVYLNYADRTNNTMAVGTYTGCGSNNPSQGTFGAEIRSDGIYASSVGSTSTLTVDYIKGNFVIVMTYNNTTYGYIGMPEGWVAPGGGEEPEEPTELTALDTPEVTATASETDNSITVSWSEVANAVGYKVTFNNGNPETVTATTFTKTYTGLDWGTKYDVEVVAVAATDSEEYKDSEAGKDSATTIANPNAPTKSYENWVFSMTLSTATGALTLTDGNHTVTAKLAGKYGLGVGSYIINDTTGVFYATDVKVNGVAVSNAEGHFRLNNSYKIELDMTLDGVKYTGTSSNSL